MTTEDQNSAAEQPRPSFTEYSASLSDDQGDQESHGEDADDEGTDHQDQGDEAQDEDGGDTEQDGAEASDDGEQGDDETAERKPEPPGKLARKNIELGKQVRALSAEKRRLEQQVRELSEKRAEERWDADDPVSSFRNMAARSMGLKPDDPRVDEALEDLAFTHSLETLDPKVLEQRRDLREERDNRRRLREQRRRDRERDDEIRKLREETSTKERRLREQSELNVVATWLDGVAQEFPALVAAAGDDYHPVPHLLREYRKVEEEVIAQTGAPIPAEREAAVMRAIARDLDSYHRQKYDRLHGALQQKKDDGDAGERRSPATQKNGKKRSGYTTTGGGRGAPAVTRNQDNENSPGARPGFAEWSRAEEARQANQRRRR